MGAMDTRRSFVVNARAIADGPDAEAVLEEIGATFGPSSSASTRTWGRPKY